MVENKIVIGNNYRTIAGENIIDLTVNRSNSLMMDEMASDICEATVYNNDNYLDQLEYGTKISIYRDVAVQDVFYLTKVTRVKKELYKLEMTSFFGILESEMFYGGYYTGQNFKDIVENIIQTNGLDPTTTDHEEVLDQIEYDDGVATLPVYGWIKVLTKREALHQVLFARGISMKRSSGGNIRFSYVYDTEPTYVMEDRIYQDNDVSFLPKISNVEVEEHTYTDNAETQIQVLFENRQATELGKTYIAVFNCDAPVLRNVQTTGLLIHYQNCNAAVVTGIGSISGYPSIHSTTMIKETIRQVAGDTVTFSGNTLITIANSAFIMDRLKSYYLSAETEVSTDIIRENERTGSHVSVVNSFAERVSGFITQMAETYSGIVKAACKIITGYHPVTPLAGYSRSVVLSGSGGWIVPESVYLKADPTIKVVLVGGGTGGYSGLAGQSGSMGRPQGTGAFGDHGEDGDGGTGGKIYTFTITNPAQTLYYACGQGGTGGAANSSTTTANAGIAGADTTITNGSSMHSSASGQRNAAGVIDFITGMQYGMSYYQRGIGQYFKDANWAGRGGYDYGDSEWWNNANYYDFNFSVNPPTYEYVHTEAGGRGSSGSGRWYYVGNQSSYVEGPAYGGAGGGAAAGSAGGRGGNAATNTHADKYAIAARGGKGGTGGSAVVVPPKPNLARQAGFLPWDDGGFGDGGFGGHGGGGGGAGGATIDFTYDGLSGFVGGQGGAGGYGGQGGSGGDGCIIVYY